MKLLLLLLLIPVAAAECLEPFDAMQINESVRFCSDAFDAPNGISIVADNVTLDCGTAVLRGDPDSSETGIRADNVKNITIQNCNVVTYNVGIYLKNVTFSHLIDNALIKNDVGIRLLESYENIIEENNDKSLVRAVSAVNSKFNIVMLGNKPVEHGFCEVNACNVYRDMNPCETGDFYCSPRCSAETDADCKAPVTEEAAPVVTGKTVEQIEQEVRAETKEEAKETVQELEPVRELPIGIQLVIYLITYIIGFGIVQSYIYQNR